MPTWRMVLSEEQSAKPALKAFENMSVSIEELKKVIAKSLEPIAAKLQALTDNLESYKKTVEFMSSKYDDLLEQKKGQTNDIKCSS